MLGALGTIGLGQDLDLVLGIETDDGPGWDIAFGVDFAIRCRVADRVDPIAHGRIVIPGRILMKRIEETRIDRQILLIVGEELGRRAGIEFAFVGGDFPRCDEQFQLRLCQINPGYMHNMRSRLGEGDPLIGRAGAKFHCEGLWGGAMEVGDGLKGDR